MIPPQLLQAALAALTLAAPAARDFEVAPRTIEWEQLSPARFDLVWRLPETHRAPGQDLLAEMEALAALRFEYTDRQGRKLGTLGDLVAVSLSIGRDDLEGWLKDLETSAPPPLRARSEALRQLLCSDRLDNRRWDPDDDHSRDGILMGEPWDLKQEGVRPWNDIRVDVQAEQAATLMLAGLDSIKTAENDYRLYPENVGAKYREIYPLDGSFVRGEDPEGREFAALRIYFRSPLPLWYDDYRCELNSLTQIDARGRVVCHIYSRSDDFHWMAGRDVFLPVETSLGQRLAYLVVRQYGFDIDDVPDKPGNRRAALRGSLGNLRRRAEALAGERPRLETGPLVPEFALRGKRP